MSETALDRVFAYYGNRATPQDYFDAAREMLDNRRRIRKEAAEKLRAKRAEFFRIMRENGISISEPFIKAIWMHARHEAMSCERATIPAMLAELERLDAAALARLSPEYQHHMNSLPCGLQDASDMRRHEDATLARLLPLMIWLAEWEGA